MTLKLFLASYAIGAFSLISGCATKESEHSLILRHAKVTLMEAAVVAEKMVPNSQAIKVELTHSNEAVFYEVDVLKKVLVDAEDGHIIRSE
jgi:uncharacterized membrane protein YkoI